MTKKNRVVLAASASAAVLSALAVLAVNSPAAAQDDDSSADAGSNDRIIVTGSRIRRPGLDAPTPLTVVGAETIARQGDVNLGNVLAQMPSLGSTFNSGASTRDVGTAGLALADLRRLGVDRTLVLIDGRRHVAGQAGSAAVDLSTIPVDLVERVEIITGGASAVYGADAVSGVVNIITKRDFEGVELFSQAGQAHEGDALAYTFRGTAGTNFAGDRGNAVISAEWTDTNGFTARDRSFGRLNQGFLNNPEDTDVISGGNDGIPDRILVDDFRLFTFADGGQLFVPGVGPQLFRFDGAGGLAPFDFGDIVSFDEGFASGGDGYPFVDILNDAQPDSQKLVINGRVEYEIDPRLRFFGEGKYVHSETFFEFLPSFDLGALDGSLFFTLENPLIPAPTQQILIDNGVPFFLMSRIHEDLGKRGEDIERNTYRSVVGFEGDFENGWNYELSYVFGRTESTALQLNNRITERFFAAIDVVRDPGTGQPVCRVSVDPVAASLFSADTVSGCTPANLFGVNTISQEARNFINTDSPIDDEIEQHVVTFVLAGDSSPWFELPAGPIGVAFGGEYRSEMSSSVPAEEIQQGLTLQSVTQPVSGSFDVWEGFGEVSIPVLSGLPFIDSLTVDAAVRYADYSTIGGNTSWKIGGVWAPHSDFRVRGAYSRAVRAPNIVELFAPDLQTFRFFSDPCDVDNLDSGTAMRAANCLALGAPANFEQVLATNTPGTISGNSDLNAETAKTITVGAVWTPQTIPGLSLTVDFYDIKIRDAISSPSLDDVISNCVDALAIDNEFCPLITRDPGTFQVQTFRLIEQNFSALEAQGLDFEANYGFELDDIGLENAGNLNLRLVGNKVFKRKDFPFQGAPDESNDEKGELGDPEWALNFYTSWNLGRFTFNYDLRYVSSQVHIEIDDLRSDPDAVFPFETGKAITHNIQGNFQLSDSVAIFAGINNLTETFPPFGFLGGGALISDSSGFDNVGRFYYGGVKIAFGGN